MKLSRFIVMFVGCVAFFAMLFQFQPLVARGRTGLGIQLYHEVVDSSDGWDEPFFEDPPMGFSSGVATDWCFIKDEIIAEIESSGKINAKETKELFNNVEAAMDGQPFVPTYATSENMDLLEKCVNTVEFIYGCTPKCKQLNVKIVQIKSIFFQ